MSAFVEVHARDAEKMKKSLLRNNLMDKRRNVEHSKSYVLFPVVDIASERIKKLINSGGGRIVRKRGKNAAKVSSYLDLLREKLGDYELKRLTSGYDLLGNIALIELPKELEGRKRTIAEAIISANGSVKTVLEKAGPVSGAYRIRKLRYVAGKRNYTANYRENGCTFVFDVRKVFFSNRLSYERSRISSLVKDGERVVVMFAGVGPFVAVIAKEHRDARVIGIELNRAAYGYMKQNIRLNRLENAEAVLGDVKKAYKRYASYADRVIMPLPMNSELFIKEALAVAKNNAVVHLYTFCKIGDAASAFKRIKKRAEGYGCKIKLAGARVVRPYSAEEEECVLDLKVRKIG